MPKKTISLRLTKPHTPKRNGMVERVNGIMKQGTILKEQFTDRQTMEAALMPGVLHLFTEGMVA